MINFLRSIQNPQDKVGIASYNSYYTSHSMPVNDKEKISKYLEEINQPVKNEGWSNKGRLLIRLFIAIFHEFLAYQPPVF